MFKGMRNSQLLKVELYCRAYDVEVTEGVSEGVHWPNGDDVVVKRIGVDGFYENVDGDLG